MRTILIGDVLAAARVATVVSQTERENTIWRLFAAADAADRYRLATGRAHPKWGNGTLFAAAKLASPAADSGRAPPFQVEGLHAVCKALERLSDLGQVAALDIV